MAKRVLWWGRFDPGYSRNRVYAALFRELGWEVDYFFVKVWPRFGDVEAFLRGLGFRPRPDLVWVPVARQRDVAAACRWAHRRGIPVVFDPMISAWDKKVLEQKKWRAEEPRAQKLLARETALMNAPDLVCWDTSCHVDFCAEYLKVPREKLRVLLTGTDESVFRVPRAECGVPRAESEVQSPVFKVLYHGAYLPLHGTEVIVEAARRTQGTGIHWDFLGWGAYKAATEAKAAGLENVTFLEKVPYVDVPKVIAAHDVVLGVFGTTAKAARVIGNKVYECMACARPTINEYCTGYPPEARTCPAIKFIPPGDPAALVAAVEEYRADWARREHYFAAARRFFEEHLSMAVIKEQLRGILDDVLASRAVRTLAVCLLAAGLAGTGRAAAPSPVTDTLYIDTMVQFTLTAPGDEPEVGAADKLAIWLGEDAAHRRVFYVQAKRYDWVAAPAGANGLRLGGGAVVTGRPAGKPVRFTLTGAGEGGKEIVPGSWCRLTVRAFRNLFATDAHGVVPCFRITLDGTPLKVAEGSAAPFTPAMRKMLDGFAAPALKGLIADGQILPSLEPMGAPGHQVALTGVDFKGSGGLEDMVVSDNAATFNPGFSSADFTLWEPQSVVGHILGQARVPSPAP